MTTMPIDDFPRVSAEALDRYFTGACSADDAVQVEAAMAQNPALAALRRGVEGELGEGGEPVDVAAAWRRFVAVQWDHARHGAGVGARSAGRSAGGPAGRVLGGAFPRWGIFKKQPLRRHLWYSITAACFLAVIAVVLGWHAHSRTRSSGQRMAMAVYETSNGQRANVTLTDGTQVVLNVASRLEVPADYATGDRTVRLTGEAFFTAAHHSKQPFTVTTGTTVVRVLGTSFLVRHYTADSLATVAVREGKVTVHSPSARTVVLSKAQQLTVGPRGIGNVRPPNPEQFGFVTGVLALSNVPLPDAITDLDRWCDVDIRLGDTSLTSRRITGEYGACTTADLINILEMTFTARVVRDGRVLTLFPR